MSSPSRGAGAAATSASQGGSIEGEETPFDALVREVKEETNLDVHAAHHAFSRVDKTTAGKVAWTYVVTE